MSADPRAEYERLARATQLRPHDPAAWRDLGVFYLGLGQAADALRLFERALHAGPDLPACLYLCHLRQQAGDLGGAERAARAALALDPASADAWFLLGSVQTAAGTPAEAAASYARSAERRPEAAETWHNLGIARDAAGDKPGALAAFRRALGVDPGLAASLAQAVYLQRELCDWEGLDAAAARLHAAVEAGVPGATPFSFLSEPVSPALQLRCARLHAARLEAEAAPLRARLGAAPAARTTAGEEDIRVGFVSSGFNNHPTALLVVELIERLRGSGLATVGIATRPDDGGALRRRLAAAFDGFVDAGALSMPALAARLRAERLDIVFDLRGYGDGTVSEAFAARVAPVQVNWLAYPGTSGAGFIDWLLADAVTVDAANRDGFSEAVLRLPHCFQPSDTTREVGVPPPREALGLPTAGPVLASFNNAYKISPAVFDAWMRILAGAPDACLWLLCAKHPDADRRLRAAAAARGVDPARLVFQPKLPHAQYLALYRHADLFLDTWPYGAHTTASDALWAGCPLLTLPGPTFASRVGASLLSTLGVADALVAGDVEDYVARAVALAGDADARARLAARLRQARDDAPLFDMRRFATDFARAVRHMVARSRAGLAPADHDLPPTGAPP
ncbi:tetratricopeptide repeat protein [Coralloluteibacterium thermophilus]|uniref:protein O-GlcNAc transferase n=1 Tax=Coralloluteibacterium thermophilum TaxID=2707049 RepID=A0ABV9NJM8_9GAMM